MRLLFPLLLLLCAGPLLAAKDKLPTAGERWRDAATAEPPSFRRHVVPLMSRTGCSGRECHGAFSGQGGFQLSLFGYDFDHDFAEIANDKDDGPRIDLEHPEQSLILTKPALDGEKHKGKKRFDKGSWEYNLLRTWVANGAKLDVKETGEFDKLDVTPRELIFQRPGDTVQLRVMAHWRDGTVEDVTQLTRFRTNDESVADVSPTGLVTCKDKGDTHIIAFYDNGVLPVPAMLPSSALTGPNFPKVPARSKVDQLVVGKLRKIGVVPSDLCTDAEFLRRASLDISATLPAPEEVRAFLADQSSDKRRRKIDELLASPGYAAWWTTLLCDFGGNDPRRLPAPTGDQNFFSERFSRQWYDWLLTRLARNEPYDMIAEGIIMASGRSRPDQTYEEYALEMSSYFCTEKPASFNERPNMPYFWMRNNIRKPEEKALAFAHTFLGVRIECAQCHKHPFDQWTKTDFEQFQAFFEPIKFAGKPSGSPDTGFNKAARDFKESLPPDMAGNQKYRATEFRKRIDEGWVLPWPELFVEVKQQPKRDLSPKEVERMKQKNPNFSGRVLTPKILGGDEVMLTEYPDPRAPLMTWLRDKHNPYFARSFVNRVWASYFGRGIVDPPDDMNLANPPVNRELFDYLTDGFIAHDYDIRWLHREIANSDTYQRSWKPNDSNRLDEKNFSHAIIRRLPAEAVFDAVRMATAGTDTQAKLRRDMTERAIGPLGTNYKGQGRDSYALNTFGKPSRNMNCDCERTSDPTLLQTIFTRNDPALLQLIDTQKREGAAWIEELRRQSDPEFSPQRLRAVLSNLEQRREQSQKKFDSVAIEQPKALQLRERFERTVKEIDTQIERTNAELARAEARKPFDLNRAIEDAFLRTVSRPPTADEIAKAKEDIAAAKTPAEGLKEVLWAMLNAREFIVNH